MSRTYQTRPPRGWGEITGPVPQGQDQDTRSNPGEGGVATIQEIEKCTVGDRLPIPEAPKADLPWPYSGA
jgi:hypothetical protein